MKMRCKGCGTLYDGKTSSYRRFGYSPEESFSYAVDADGELVKECESCGADIDPNMVLGCKPEYMTPPNLVVVAESMGKGGCLHCRSGNQGFPAG